jgi:hypothetical protein
VSKTAKIILIVALVLIITMGAWFWFKSKPTNINQTTEPSGKLPNAVPPPPGSTESFPLAKGMSGMNVKRLQTALNWIKPANKLELDGNFGSQTLAALYTSVPTTLSVQPISEANFNAIIKMGNQAKGL